MAAADGFGEHDLTGGASADGEAAPDAGAAAAPLDAPDIAFFELCARLERAFPQPGGIGGTASAPRERVRFRANPTLLFPPGEVAALTMPDEAGGRLEVVVNLLGLYGPSSPLPPALTERIVFADKAGTLRDFLDFFNHRLTALLYRSWKHYRHHLRYEPGARDAISRAVASLFGTGGEGGDEAALPARTLLLPYAGVLAQYGRSAQMVAGVVEHYFRVPCAIVEFVEREVRIPDRSLLRLGETNCELGLDAVIGESVRDIQGKFRLRLGPLAFERYRAFLPGEPAFETLGDLIRLSLREPLDWDYEFVLQPGEAAPARLGEARLGWFGWLDPDLGETVSVVIDSTPPNPMEGTLADVT